MTALLAFVLARPASEIDYERQLSEMRAPDPARRRAAAEAILRVPAERLPALVARLQRGRRATPARWRAVLLAIGADLPPEPARGNTPRPAPKKPPRPEPPPPEIDWLARLAELGADDAEALAEALEAVALVRAIARTGRSDAVAPLLRLAWSHEGVFRDECGRRIREMGRAAVPGLLRAQRDTSPKTYRLRRYALYQLERMGFADPRAALGDADAATKADILRAYGELKWDAAVEAVLPECDSSSRRVRETARRAFRRYVEGRAPREPKRKLKLPGGELSEKEVALYLTYRQRAEIELRKRLLGEANLAPPDGTTPADLARWLFDFYDRRRAERHEADLERAEEAWRAGRLDEAVRVADEVLVKDPFQRDRARLAPIYYAWGERQVASGTGDRGGARARAFRQAARLDPAGPLRRRAEARAAYLDALAALPADPAGAEQLLWQARGWDPDFYDAEQALTDLRAQRRHRRTRTGVTAAGVLLVLGVGFFVGWRRLG